MNVHDPIMGATISPTDIDKEVYYSPDVARLETERLWPRAWQVACREEDLPSVGSYWTYDIMNQSVLVVRTSDSEIRAYNNACRHRGRRLTTDCGHASIFTCRFHGWKWQLDGKNCNITDGHEFGDTFGDDDLSLMEFKVGRWGGFVFVNMDPEAVEFGEWIAPVAKYLDPMEFDKQRYRWYISVEVEANWKVTQEAFMESYHVAYTHPKLEPYLDSRSLSIVYGDLGHGQVRTLPLQDWIPGAHLPPRKTPIDERVAAYESIRQQAHDIQSIFCDRDAQAAARVLTECPEGTSYGDAIIAAMGFMRESAISSGAGWPDMTPEQAYEAGFDWIIFPNTVCVLSPTGGLWYRCLPSPDGNPDRCTFEMYALERFTPGAEPAVERKHFANWRDCPNLPSFLIADFINTPEVHRGLKTIGFPRPYFNPVQEGTIANFHRVLRNYLYEDT